MRINTQHIHNRELVIAVPFLFIKSLADSLHISRIFLHASDQGCSLTPDGSSATRSIQTNHSINVSEMSVNK